MTATIEYTEKVIYTSDIAGLKKFWRDNRERDIKFADISESDRLIITGKKKKFWKG